MPSRPLLRLHAPPAWQARLLAALAAASLLVVPRAGAQVAPACSPGEALRYASGLKALREALGPIMGDPLTCEFPDPNGTGDVHQRTTEGLAYWRKRTNTPTFTNGWDHWALTSAGLAHWAGPSVDPPGQADEAVTAAEFGLAAAPTGRIEGVIVTAGGWSLEGRLVSLFRGAPEAEAVAVARVEAANQFAFDAVPAGDGFFVLLQGVDSGPLGPCSAPRSISVAPGQTTWVAISCRR